MANDKKFELVIFDMDGVILRSDLLYYEIARQINTEINYTDLSCGISQGGKILFKSIFGDNYTEKNINWFRKMQVKAFNRNTHLYEDIHEIITNVSKYYKLAMVSNKPVACIEGILKDINLYDLFNIIVGRDSGHGVKPQPDGLNHVIKNMKVEKNKVIYFGDAISDYHACIKAGITFAHCKYGFDESIVECKYVLSKTEEIRDILDL